MRLSALPDSNTSPRVTISVLGHVAVSQMGVVQVPYATVTVKYFRALTTTNNDDDDDDDDKTDYILLNSYSYH